MTAGKESSPLKTMLPGWGPGLTALTGHVKQPSLSCESHGDEDQADRVRCSPGCSWFSWICWGVVSTMRLWGCRSATMGVCVSVTCGGRISAPGLGGGWITWGESAGHVSTHPHPQGGCRHPSPAQGPSRPKRPVRLDGAPRPVPPPPPRAPGAEPHVGPRAAPGGQHPQST